MLLGALVDAGADAAEVDGHRRRARCRRVLADVRAHPARWHRCDLVLSWPTDAGDHEHRPVRPIEQLLDAADLAGRVRDRRRARVRRPRRRRGRGARHRPRRRRAPRGRRARRDRRRRRHRAPRCESLGVDRIIASPIAVGHGIVRASHGDLPNPPPAVARLLAGRSVPIVGVDTTMELATPTGVAVLVALADGFGPMPAMTVEAVGYGAGRADPAGRPNVVQVLVGESDEGTPTPGRGRAAVQLEINVDDVTGEVIAHAIAARSPPARTTRGRRRS